MISADASRSSSRPSQHFAPATSPVQLRSLGIERAIRWDHEADLILLPVSSWGLVPSGSAKGYAYSSTPLRPATEAETDDYTGDMPNEIVYRHIKGLWYVYYERW